MSASETAPLIDTGSAEHERRMKAARERAEWELGDGSWASVIVGAYLWPDADAANLAHEKAEA